jgi:hypothetical protein
MAVLDLGVGELMAPFLAAAGKDSTAIGRLHSLTKADFALALDIGLVAKIEFHGYPTLIRLRLKRGLYHKIPR